MSTAFSDAHLLSQVRVLVCRCRSHAAWNDFRDALHPENAIMIPSQHHADTATPWLTIAGREFHSRLMLGTGKYRTREEMRAALEASGAEIITVALRRIDFDDPASRSILEDIDTSRFAILPNTAGCKTAEEAVRIARMADAMGLGKWVKLEVIPDAKYLLPDPIGTLEAARTLVAEGFAVLPYIGADPPLARHLAEIGCTTVMPLGSPIGSGQGLINLEAIRIIIEQATVPVVVDAGIGAPSDAALAMEQGADACLVNTAVALAHDPALMAEAIADGVRAGRKSFLAGRIPRLLYASASSPLAGVVGAA
jgi:thiazole synthase